MRGSWTRPVAIYSAALALFLATEFTLFRNPFYRTLLEPESYAGEVELLLAAQRNFAHAPAGTVLVLGDSRIREGFSAKIADESGGDALLRFVNGAISGSTPRSWYYILRELDPQATRYGVIVLPADDYRDEDGVWSWADYPIDLPTVTACLRLDDAFGFAASFHGLDERFHALRGALLKGFVYKDDVQAFLADPRSRLARVENSRNHSAAWNYEYPGRSESLAGLTVDWSRRTIHFPAGVEEARRNDLAAAILRETTPQFGDKYRYRKYWLERILDRYRSKDTRVVFARVPRLPVQRPEPDLHLPSAIRELAAANSHCVLLDEDVLSGLEKPEYFFDSLHLNARGRALLSQDLAARIRKALAR